MATPPVGAPNPVQAMMARQLIQRMAQGQGGANDQAMGNQLGAQFSQLQGADPQFMLKALNQVKRMLTPMFDRAAFAVPEVARHVAGAVKSLDAAIKAAEQGSATQQSVRPIANNAAMPNPTQNPGGGEPMSGPPGGGGVPGLP